MLLVPGMALAEVSDKIPSMVNLVVSGLVVSVLAFILAIRNLKLALINVLILAWFLEGFWWLWSDAALREAVLHEQGGIYFVLLIGRILLLLLASILGVWFKLRLTKLNKNM